MGLKSAFKKFFDLEEEVEEKADSVFPERRGRDEFPASSIRDPESAEKSGKLVALQSARPKEKVILAEPKTFEEVRELVNDLKNRQLVICSLQETDRTTGQRILDFMGGTLFAMNGQIRKIGKDTFLFVPENVTVFGSISDWKTEDHF